MERNISFGGGFVSQEELGALQTALEQVVEIEPVQPVEGEEE